MSYKPNGKDAFDLDAPVSTFGPGDSHANDICETQGVRANRQRAFKLQMDGEDLYDLLELLRRVAVESGQYQVVARAVTYERLLYTQARDQGF